MGTVAIVADDAATPDPKPVDRLHDHLADVDDRSDEMQERLDDLGEGIEAARRQARSDELLPDEDADADAEAPLDDWVDWPEGDAERETPVTDTDHPPTG